MIKVSRRAIQYDCLWSRVIDKKGLLHLWPDFWGNTSAVASKLLFVTIELNCLL